MPASESTSWQASARNRLNFLTAPTSARTVQMASAISGLCDFRVMRDPALVDPVPQTGAARRSSSAQRAGCWRIWTARSPGRGCGCGSRGDCPAGWIGSRPLRCWAVSHRPGSGDRRVDVVFRVALGPRCSALWSGMWISAAAGSGSSARATRNGGCRWISTSRPGAVVSVRGATGLGERPIVSGVEGFLPGPPLTPGRVAHGVPLPPRAYRGASRSSGCIAAFIRHPLGPRPVLTWRCCKP